MAKVEVISSCLVGTRLDIVSSISRLELIAWDLRLLPRNYIQRGLIFQKPQEIAENLIDGLKSSLSRTLEWFPPLAGRLCSSADDGELSRLFVDCNNAGAEFRHAVAGDVSVADILEAKYTPQVVYSLFPRDGGVYNIDGLSAPLLAVQVTELADGLFLACSANHCVVDGEGELLDEKGLGYTALKINDVISQQTTETATRDAEMKVEFGGKHRPSRSLFIGSSPRDDVYGNDFGWGKPVGVRSGETQKREGCVVLFPAPEAGGIDVELCLPQETLEAMESDADFVRPLTNY